MRALFLAASLLIVQSTSVDDPKLVNPNVEDILRTESELLSDIVSSRDDFSTKYNAAVQSNKSKYLPTGGKRRSLRRNNMPAPNSKLGEIEKLTLSQAVRRAIRDLRFDEIHKEFTQEVQSPSQISQPKFESLVRKSRSVSKLVAENVADLSAFIALISEFNPQDSSIMSPSWSIKELLDRENRLLERSVSNEDALSAGLQGLLPLYDSQTLLVKESVSDDKDVDEAEKKHATEKEYDMDTISGDMIPEAEDSSNTTEIEILTLAASEGLNKNQAFHLETEGFAETFEIVDAPSPESDALSEAESLFLNPINSSGYPDSYADSDDDFVKIDKNAGFS